MISLRRKHSTESKIDHSYYFSQLSEKMIEALHQKYRLDFEMFEYTVDKYMKYATDSKQLMPDVIEVKAKLTDSGVQETYEEDDTTTTNNTQD